MKKNYIAPLVEVTEATEQFSLCAGSIRSTWGGKDAENTQEFVNDIWHNEGYGYNGTIVVSDDNGTLDSQSNRGLWE